MNSLALVTSYHFRNIAGSHLETAIAMRKAGLYREAISRIMLFFQSFDISNGQKQRGYTEIGANCMALKKYDEARQWFEKTLAINPKDLAFQNRIGQSYMQEGKYSEARDAFEKTLVVDPKNTAAQTSIGQSYMQEGKYREARDAFEKALRADPNDVVAQTSIGQSYMEEKKYSEARDAFKKTLVVDPKDIVAIYGSMKCDFYQGESSQKKMTYIVKYINSISAPDKIFLRNISFLLIRIADKSHPFFEVIRNLHPDTEYITQLIEDINIARTNENELEKLEKIHMRSSNVFTGYHIPKPINKTARDVMINTPHT